MHQDVDPHLRSWVDISLDALGRNATRIVERSQRPMIAMIKADAYGHGMVEVARALLRWSQHASTKIREPLFGFGTATLEECLLLRDHFEASEASIVCCAPLLPDELQVALDANVIPALHTAQAIERWHQLGGGAWHLSIDTGMQRAGVRWDAVENLRTAIALHPPAAVFTHFHSSEADDGSCEVQDARFRSAIEALGISPERTLLHADNSGAIAARAPSPYHLVRPGLSLYGGFATPTLPTEPIAAIRARIVDIHELHGGDTVSYNATWCASRPCRVATLGIGYGDGYRQHFSNATQVLVGGRRAAVVGKVTMDMTMVDVTDIPCNTGDIVTLLGREGNEVIRPEELAAAGGLSVYELFVGLRLRMPRLHVGRLV